MDNEIVAWSKIRTIFRKVYTDEKYIDDYGNWLGENYLVRNEVFKVMFKKDFKGAKKKRLLKMNRNSRSE